MFKEACSNVLRCKLELLSLFSLSSFVFKFVILIGLFSLFNSISTFVSHLMPK